MRIRTSEHQLSRLDRREIDAAAASAAAAGVDARGAVFTKLEVVELILDLTASAVDRPLRGSE